MDIILASASQRRKELLKKIIDDFQIIVSDFNEGKVKFQGDCGLYVMELSKGKALNVCEKVRNPSIIIGCDTVVYFNGKVLGKPNDKKEAFKMLKNLSGNIHSVYSGITIINTASNKIKQCYVHTEVKFSNITERQITTYIDRENVLDKAGAYGIQDYAAVFVEEIQGCYYNVVGLPLNKLYFMLKEMGVNL
jgi:septum formation protein